jgi:hypothetical protein
MCIKHLSHIKSCLNPYLAIVDTSSPQYLPAKGSFPQLLSLGNAKRFMAMVPGG